MSETERAALVSACCGSGLKRIKGLGMVCSACQEPSFLRGTEDTDTEQ